MIGPCLGNLYCANFVKIKSYQLTSRKTTKKQGLSRKLKAKSKIIFNS